MSPFLRPTYIISILIAIAVHEWAHAYTANKLGDPTAEQEGRLTLNPLSHLDPIGALMFLIVGFGWAKPVPVNPLYFRHAVRDMAIVALAGPFSNLILALFAFGALAMLNGDIGSSVFALLQNAHGSSPALTLVLQILQDSLFVNLALMAFNLFPIAPLDGSNVLRLFIPRNHQDRYEDFVRIGPWILLFFIIFESFLPVQLLSAWVQTIMSAVLQAFGVVFSAFG